MAKYKSIFDAIKANDIEAVKTFLPDQLEAKDRFSLAPLHRACMWGNIEIVRMLLDYGADMDARDEYGETALHRACMYSHTEIIRLLLDRGADINAITKEGYTPLHTFCQNNENSPVEIIILLFDRGADIEARDRHGNTPLHYACMWGNTKKVYMLLDNNANIKAKNKHDEMPLHKACFCGQHTIAELMVSQGVDPYALDCEGKSSIDYDNRIVTDKDGNEIQHSQILIQLYTNYLNQHTANESGHTGTLSSGWEMEM